MRRALSFALALVGCDPQKADWGFQAIDSMKTPADDPNLGCGFVPPPSKALSCSYQAGAHSSETLGVSGSAIPIRHVIIMMKENRSFDHLLGRLHDRGRPDVEALPLSYSNPDTQGNPVFFTHPNTTCIPFDPGHQSGSVLACMDDGRMDGFVRNAASTTASDGTFVMGTYDDLDLPFYYWLATTFAISDRHFAPMATGTYGNRDFLMFATNAGVVDTGIVFPPPTTPSLMQLLMNRGFTWGAYSDGSPLSGALDWGPGDPGVHSLHELFDALDHGTLPNVVFVDGYDYVDDDHPEADLERGERWVKGIYDRAVKSPQWPSLAIVWTYDEAGGFADHVPPPTGCEALPSTSTPTLMGPRVPLVVISPWAKRRYASHVVHDHTAITRFVETVFDLPALTARDANSDALLDMFDFSCGRDLTVPDAPDPGSGGCLNPNAN